MFTFLQSCSTVTVILPLLIGPLMLFFLSLLSLLKGTTLHVWKYTTSCLALPEFTVCAWGLIRVCVHLQVLATGLSGLYSSLPARLQVYSEDWHCLDQADWQQVICVSQFNIC